MATTRSAEPNRLRELRRVMRAHGCTHLLISDTVDVHYASGFESSNVSIVLAPGEALLCSDFRYQEALKAHCRRNPPWRPVIITESDFGFLRRFVPRGSRLGLQSNVVTLDQHDRLRKALPGVKMVRLGTAVSDVFMVKTAGELRKMTRAARIACSALRRVVGRIKIGLTEREVRDMLEEQCDRLGSEHPAFETIVLFGRRSALPHGVPSNVRLRRGDFVLFDFGCTVDGFCSDITRTFVMGRASAQQREVYNIVRHAQQQARTAVRHGVKASTIDGIARRSIEQAGYGEQFGHATGHGVGYRIHEAPRVSARTSAKLRTGFVVTVEPGIYIPSLGGVRIEDTVCVTPQGARILTRFPRGLTEL
ncbi:MAG: M24 family metallopeptidase [Chitinivibrionales bacterium]|nr:M24 family metallopeptidase [Chitinivibrionales bacterium]